MLNTNFIKNESDNKILSLPNYSEFNLNNEKFPRKETSIPKKKKNKLLFISKKEGEKDLDLNKTNTFLKKKHDLKENFFLKHNLNGRWSLDEQMLFVDSTLEFGSDWKKIHEKFSTRTITQIRSHAQKFLMKLKVNAYLKEKGLEYDFCWSKAITYLKSVLSHSSFLLLKLRMQASVQVYGLSIPQSLPHRYANHQTSFAPSNHNPEKHIARLF